MKGSLVVIEFIIFVPAAIYLFALLYPKQSTTTRRIYLLVYLTLPPMLYNDHAHFQPNSPMYGFVLWATYFALTSRLEQAVVAMVLAVNFK